MLKYRHFYLTTLIGGLWRQCLSAPKARRLELASVILNDEAVVAQIVRIVGTTMKLVEYHGTIPAKEALFSADKLHAECPCVLCWGCMSDVISRRLRKGTTFCKWFFCWRSGIFGTWQNPHPTAAGHIATERLRVRTRWSDILCSGLRQHLLE